MVKPEVSVVIPAYNQAQFLGKAIRSVLNQTFTNFELIVVNDASPDRTDEVVREFQDSRLKYIVHKENRGLPAARNSGMRAANGETIALLDSDDYFHPEKLQTHAKFLASHPDVQVSYNARYELDHSSESIREIYVPPLSVGLSDFVVGFPFSPSDMVVRRSAAFSVNFFDESLRNGAEDLDFPCRLALEGHKFRGINRALNYRRYHAGRTYKNIHKRIRDVHQALRKVFDDPSCPSRIRSMRYEAFASHYMVHSFPAFIQEQTELGVELLQMTVKFKSDITRGNPCPYTRFLSIYASQNKREDPRTVLNSIFQQLPKDFAHLKSQSEWAVGYAYLTKALRSCIWGQESESSASLGNALEYSVRIDDQLLTYVLDQLVALDREWGAVKSQSAISRLSEVLKVVEGRSSIRWLQGYFKQNQAFRYFREEQVGLAIGKVFSSIRSQPRLIFNRGVLSILTYPVRKLFIA